MPFRSHISKFASAILILTMAGATILSAEPATVEKLSVDELVQQVLEQNAELRAAEFDVDAARGQRRSSGQWKNPEITAEYAEKRIFEAGADLRSKGTAQRYGFGQTFEFPGKASLRKAIADQDVQLAELALEQLRLEVAARVRSLAIEWFTAYHESLATDLVVERNETLVEMLHRRAPAGIPSVLDRNIIEADQIRILAHAHEIEEKKETAQIRLNILRGKPPHTGLQLTGALEPPVIHTPLQALIERAQSNNLTLKASALETERARKSIHHAALKAAPDFTVGPFFSRETASSEREELIGVGVSLPLPLWDSNRGEVQTSRALLAKTQATGDQRSQENMRELITQFEAYAHIGHILEKYPLTILDKLRDASDLADRQYRLGAISIQIYIEMQDKYLEATEKLLHLVHEANEHYLKIQIVTSDPTLLNGTERRKSP